MLLAVAACAGPEFTGGSSSSLGGAGSQSGGASNGGVGTGGAGGSGGSNTKGGSGGILGTGGLGIGGLLGTGGGSAGTFPTTKILDTFNRENGVVGSNWLGATSAFAIRDQRLRDVTSAGYPIHWSAFFGATQEAFATFVGFSNSAQEINLTLKAQGTSDCELIEVLYRPERGEVGVEFCVGTNDWHTLQSFDVTFAPGDKLGARATADGDVLLFVNGALLGTVDVREFPYYQEQGRIGVNSAGGAGEATWDDFGGGTAPP